MKKSELNFKCVVPGNDVSSSICRMLGVKSIYVTGSFIQCKNGSYAASSKADVFCSWPEPPMNYEDALKLIESIEPDAPEFDIKTFDKILTRNESRGIWYARFFERAAKSTFAETGACFFNQIMKYERNEQYHGTTDTPTCWWECENGKPVWRTK